MRSTLPALQAAVAGGLLAIAQLGTATGPLVFVALALFFDALERPGPDDSSSGGGWGRGFVFGLCAAAIGYAWLSDGLLRLTGGALPAALLWCVQVIWYATGSALCGAATRALRAHRWSLLAAGPIPVVVVEALQPQVFAAPIGAALLPVLPLAQLAEFGGGLALTAFVAFAAAGIAIAFRAGRSGGLAALSWTALGLAGVAGIGALRMGSLIGEPENATLEIGIVQAAIPLDEKRRSPEASRDRHAALSGPLLSEGPLDLVIWPEGAFARALRRPLPLDGEQIRAGVDAPLLFGGVGLDVVGGRRSRANTAFLVGADGWIRSAVDKQQLIPLAETAAPALLAGRIPLPGAAAFRPATAAASLPFEGRQIAVPICYEAADGGFVRELVRATDAGLLVSLADDGWFLGTREPELHFKLVRLRAIEQRRWIVRAANLGFSGIIDPLGRVQARSEAIEPGTLRGTVAWREERSLYARIGELPVWLALLVVAWLGRPRAPLIRGE